MNRPPQPKDYKIVFKPTSVELTNEVNALIADGWIPIGGVSVAVEPSDGNPVGGDFVFCQAMVLI